jgi:hypothetical protein
MGYVDAAKPDIFISYAQVNNQPDRDEPVGWVTALHEKMQKHIDQRLGRALACEIWMDEKLAAGESLNEGIRQKVVDSQLMLVVLSPGYVASAWCGREIEWFLAKEKVGGGKSQSPIVVIEHDAVDARPESLKDILSIPFYEKDAMTEVTMPLYPRPGARNDDPYYRRLYRLTSNLADELERLRKGHVAPAYTDARATVFLAEPTEDLEDLHDEVRSFLAVERGYRVLPAEGQAYPRDAVAFEEAVKKDLGQSELFVQLVSNLIGRKLDGSGERSVAALYRCASSWALARGNGPSGERRILQWRSPDLDLKAIAAKDSARGAFLQGPDCLAIPMDEFRRAVASRIEALIRPPSDLARMKTGGALGKLVLLNAEPADGALARSVHAALVDIGAWVVVPRVDGKPNELQIDLDEKLTECDGIMLIYGQSPATWIERQLLRSRKALAFREATPPVALYEVPPPDPHDPVGVAFKTLKRIKAEAFPDLGEIQEFYNAL